MSKKSFWKDYVKICLSWLKTPLAIFFLILGYFIINALLFSDVVGGVPKEFWLRIVLGIVIPPLGLITYIFHYTPIVFFLWLFDIEKMRTNWQGPYNHIGNKELLW